MRNRTVSPFAVAAAAGAALALPGLAGAQSVVNISGATLFEAFFRAPASTNDYFDVDGDGIARVFGTTQQLAPFNLPPDPLGQHWAVQYRAVGSGNGLAEMVKFGQVFVETGDGVDLKSTDAENAYYNRNKWKDKVNGLTNISNTGNPGAAPVRSTEDGTYEATFSFPNLPSAGGIQIDIAVMDVPTRWFVTQNGTAGIFATPGQPGYGLNARIATEKDGSPNGQGNKLKSLGSLNLFDPGHPEKADANTVFDSPVAFAPICVMTNLGTGMEQIDASALRHLSLTGRAPSGENLVFSTRDSGSGTRNGFMNSLGIDPSWGVGENIGVKSADPVKDLIGPDFVPGNKDGTGSVEATVINHRLAIGYVGAERGVSAGWLTGGKAEVLAVRNDVRGQQVYSRPTIDNILDNGSASAYTIGGPETMATIGDPRAVSPQHGGESNGLPQPRNPEAAAYVNNITLSVAAFSGDPGGDDTLFTPGEYLATQFILVAATDRIQNPVDPSDMIPNPGLNQTLQDFTRGVNVLKNPAYQSFGTVTRDGKVPTRQTGLTYSDGVPNGNFYKDQAGNLISYGANLTGRNRIAGDFNGDGKRDLNDAAEIVKAWRDRNGGPHWDAPDGQGPLAGLPGSDAIIEVLGDFNGDGSFDKADVRYWADGLAIDPATGRLDRAAGFKAVDDAFGGNFFGASWADGRPYKNGDARFDISGPGAPHTPGFAPIGHDGVIDQSDIDYVKAQFIGNPFVKDGQATWSDLNEAAGFDLAGDMTGDLVVNQADVEAFIGGGACYPDFTKDGALDLFDFLAFVNAFNAQDLAANCVSDGQFDLFDFLCFVNAFNAGC